jgi:EXLDI family protein
VDILLTETNTGGNLSGIISKALRRYVEQEQKQPGDFEDIIVKVNQDGFFAKKRFHGRLLTQVRLREERESGTRVVTYKVYTTPKKKWAIQMKDVPSWWYSPDELIKQSERKWENFTEWNEDWKMKDWVNQDYTYRLDVYDTEEDLQLHLPERVSHAITLALMGEGGDVEELDL